MRTQLLLILLALISAPSQMALAMDESPTRSTIEAAMAAHPDNSEIQEAGQNALQALDLWEATMADQETTGQAIGDTPPMSQKMIGPSALPNAMEGLDSWDINENYFGGLIADQDWTVNDEFTGTRFALYGRFTLHREEMDAKIAECPCNPPPPAPFRMIGTITATAQWDDGDLERAYVGVSGLSLQRNYEVNAGGWRPLRDTLELGVLGHGRDDPLGVESYTEITLARAGRTWGWMPRDKPFVLFAGLGASAGFAWAESIADDYGEVSNPILGGWVTLGISRPGWGKIYVEQRAVNGFQFSSPSAGDSTSREARFRFGVIKKMTGCNTLEVFVDKRSFNFSDHRLADLYSKAKRTGVEWGCSW